MKFFENTKKTVEKQDKEKCAENCRKSEIQENVQKK